MAMGNRESHVISVAMQAKLAGASNPVLCANLRKKDGSRPIPASVVFNRPNKKIGVFGLMVPMVTERMSTKAASAFIWEDPLDTAGVAVQELRSQVDLLIALTHIGFRLDQQLAEAYPEIDVILGGHSHTVLEKPAKVGRTYIAQSGSHGQFFGRYFWSFEDQALRGSLYPLKA